MIELALSSYTMSEIATEILIILLLIAANGLLALSEMAIVSARKVRLQQRADGGDPGAQAALLLAEKPTRFFSTTQIGITLIGVLTGAFGGATIAEAIAVGLTRFPALAPYGEAIGLGIVVVSITYLSLVFGELVPKRLAQNNPESIAAGIARPMRAMARLVAPLVNFLSFSTETILRLMGAQNPTSPTVTEEEVKFLIDEGAEIGIFEAIEQDILRRVLRLGDRKLSTLMTHRMEVVWLDLDDPPDIHQAAIKASPHSHLPVAHDSLDGLIGILEVKDYWAKLANEEAIDIPGMLQEPLFVPEAMTALELLEQFKLTRNHLAIVVDEFGGVIGLITLRDVLESIVGSLPETREPEWFEAIKREDGSWLMDGKLPVDEVKDILDINELPEEARGNYETLGGMLMEQFGRIPSAGDYFEWNGMRFEVVDMDGYRVDKVLVSSL